MEKRQGRPSLSGPALPDSLHPLSSPRVYPAFLPLIEGDQTGGVERGINRALGPCSHPPSQGQKPRPVGRGSPQWKGPVSTSPHGQDNHPRMASGGEQRRSTWKTRKARPSRPSQGERRPMGERAGANARPARPVPPEREDATRRAISLECPDGPAHKAAPPRHPTAITVSRLWRRRGGHVFRWSWQGEKMLVASTAM